MSCFGYIASTLQPATFWKQCGSWLPENWRYRRGPVFAGKLDGCLGNHRLVGWGWQIPPDCRRVWDETRSKRIWERMRDELLERQIKVVGIDTAEADNIPLGFKSPGVSDGRTLELILFMYQFIGMIQQKRLSRNSEVMIIWEEGNLGLACARLVAREIRFLTLVHPRAIFLEQAAAVIMAETGISPKTLERFPSHLNKMALVIQCGRLAVLQLPANTAKAIWIKLFDYSPGWYSSLPVSVAGRAGILPGNSALAEALIRTVGGMDKEFWCGSTMLLERVNLLTEVLKGLRMPLANWQS